MWKSIIEDALVQLPELEDDSDRTSVEPSEASSEELDSTDEDYMGSSSSSETVRYLHVVVLIVNSYHLTLFVT